MDCTIHADQADRRQGIFLDDTVNATIDGQQQESVKIDPKEAALKVLEERCRLFCHELFIERPELREVII